MQFKKKMVLDYLKTNPIAKRARSKNRLHTFGPPARLRQTSACPGRNRGNVGEIFVSKKGF